MKKQLETAEEDVKEQLGLFLEVSVNIDVYHRFQNCLPLINKLQLMLVMTKYHVLLGFCNINCSTAVPLEGMHHAVFPHIWASTEEPTKVRTRTGKGLQMRWLRGETG